VVVKRREEEKGVGLEERVGKREREREKEKE
jgi:hypothetical protein